eukprot:3122810-Pleurochrysis_carterae.AAC.1
MHEGTCACAACSPRPGGAGTARSTGQSRCRRPGAGIGHERRAGRGATALPKRQAGTPAGGDGRAPHRADGENAGAMEAGPGGGEQFGQSRAGSAGAEAGAPWR